MAPMAENLRLKYSAGTLVDGGTLHFLLVSTSQHYLDELQKHLSITKTIQKDKRTYGLEVHTCKSIADILALSPSELKVQDNLNLLDFSFGREKTCIVNPNPSYINSVVKPFDLWDFAHHYQINLINGRIDDPERIVNLSKRILNLAEACCGVTNGVPLIGYV